MMPTTSTNSTNASVPINAPGTPNATNTALRKSAVQQADLALAPETLLRLSHTSERGRRAKDFPGISLSEIAARAQCDVSHISRIFRGQRTPNYILGKRLCEILQITPDQLQAICEQAREAREDGVNKH